ncbi:hypothetical protein [Pontibacillus yanchengensis]|uniref:hypothetical protein n=1 Tax=Pontibacillus yanchengensis TaxID=462910 RepID=UPI00301DC27E
MIQWEEEILIDAPVEEVWSLFSDQNIQTIMPKVEEHTLTKSKSMTWGQSIVNLIVKESALRLILLKH